MNVGFVWQSEYPWDVRIDKMVRSLVKNSCSVSVLATNKENKAKEESYLGAKVLRLPFSENKYIRKFINLPLFFNPYYIKAIKDMIVNEKLDILIVRDLPLILAGYKAIKKSKCKVKLVFDMAEDYPATFNAMDRRSFIEKYLIKNYKLSRLLEKKSINISDLIITVVEESQSRVKEVNPIKPVVVVSNTPDESFYKDFMNEEVLEKYSTTYNIVYEGNFGKKRGLETAINALTILKDKIENVRVVLVGGKDDEVEYIKEYAKKFRVEQYLICTGKVQYSVLAQYVNVADIGMVPHLKCEHTETTIPNKLFDYMCLGKPVIVSDVTPLKRVVEETDSGVVFNWEDKNDFCNKIMTIVENYSYYSENSKKAFEGKYSWKHDEVVFLGALKELY
ncbi:glycosyltransferase [Clostridium sp.]|uniref:glycosyltransferase n=1 Tax=Clostridium sp. TaxID=1506 RepID=UPI003216930C